MSSLPKPEFYPIPKLTPVLQSYDIPAPVILCSGSDPYLFLNPDIPQPVIHHSKSDPCRVDPESSMDIDPWIAYRGEIEVDTRITHLTAFEHAGGNCGEPIEIESTTSTDSSANSQVGASQIVMDVVVTKVERKNGHSLSCDVCQVTCYSQKAFKTHVEGTTHLKKTQELPVTSPIKLEISLPVANKILDQDSKMKNEFLLQSEIPVDSLFYCSIPELGCANENFPNIVAQQVIEPVCLDGFKPSNGETHNSHEKLKVHQPIWCAVCKVNCSSDKCFERHVSGKQHLKNLKASEPDKATVLPSTAIKAEVVNPYESNSTRCELCGIFCTSHYELKIHIAGKKHQKNLKKSGSLSGHNPPAAKQLLQDPTIEEGEIVEESNKRKASISSSSDNDDIVDKKKQKMMEEEDGTGGLLTCKACDVVCKGIMAFNSHVASFEHSAMVMKQVNCGYSEQ